MPTSGTGWQGHPKVPVDGSPSARPWPTAPMKLTAKNALLELTRFRGHLNTVQWTWLRTAYQNRKHDPRPGTRSCGASTNACPSPPSAIGLQRSAGRRGNCPVRVVGSGQGLRRTERRTGSANRSADRRKNIGQRIVFPMSLSFRISAIVVIEAGRQDRPENRPDFRLLYLNRLKNKSLISHGIGQ